MFHVKLINGAIYQTMAEHIKVGQIGENEALKYYKKHGFRHIESNYRSKTGEIDFIVQKATVVRFVEVKTVSRATLVTGANGKVPHETWRPIDKVDPRKLRKLLNTIQIWLSHRRYEGEWQLDIAEVWLDVARGTSKIEVLPNVIVE